MFEKFEPANANRSLSEVLNNPHRAQAKATLEHMIGLMAESGLGRDAIADLLFEALSDAVIPEGDMTGPTAVIWYAQLQRMQGGLQDQIDALEDAMDRTPRH